MRDHFKRTTTITTITKRNNSCGVRNNDNNNNSSSKMNTVIVRRSSSSSSRTFKSFFMMTTTFITTILMIEIIISNHHVVVDGFLINSSPSSSSSTCRSNNNHNHKKQWRSTATTTSSRSSSSRSVSSMIRNDCRKTTMMTIRKTKRGTQLSAINPLSTSSKMMMKMSGAGVGTAVTAFVPDHHDVTIAGSLWPIIQKFIQLTDPLQMQLVYHNIQTITEWQEIVILPFIAFMFYPLMKYCIYKYIEMTIVTTPSSDTTFDKNDQKRMIETIMNEKKQDLFSFYTITRRIQQIGQVAFSVYIMDVISITLTTLGFQFPKQIKLTSSYATIAYAAYFGSRFLVYKRFALCKFFKIRDPNDLGPYDILNRIINGIVVSIGTLGIMDYLSIQMGHAIRGLLTLGSLGTVAFTLASKDFLTALISGFVLILGKRLRVGDSVVFGDGTSGKVLKIGWLETLFRGSDNVETLVPNAKLSQQKVSNVSNTNLSQVKQTLRFRYEDSKKIPKLLADLKNEIIVSCPHLITNEKIRPFRVYWTDFKEDHLEVMIDTHHTIPLRSEEYWTNRQTVLSAILRAVEKNDVELQHL